MNTSIWCRFKSVKRCCAVFTINVDFDSKYVRLVLHLTTSIPFVASKDCVSMLSPIAVLTADACYERFIDLEYVDRVLGWDPTPTNREETQRLLWDACDTNSEPYPTRKEFTLETAKKLFEQSANSLVPYVHGRNILEAEDTTKYASDPKYWLARSRFYKFEYKRLQEEDKGRSEGSVTPEISNPQMFGETDTDRARCRAGNVARQLAKYPAGKAMLEAEDEDCSYWWRAEHFKEAHQTSETPKKVDLNPQYWQAREKRYKEKLQTEIQGSEVGRAKRAADREAEKLATFVEGSALLDAPIHDISITDVAYWHGKKRYYAYQFEHLKQTFWERWKCEHIDCQQPSPVAPMTTILEGDKYQTSALAQATNCTGLRTVGKSTRAKNTSDGKRRDSRYYLRNRNALDTTSRASAMIILQAQATNCANGPKDGKSKRAKSTSHGQRRQSKYDLRCSTANQGQGN